MNLTGLKNKLFIALAGLLITSNLFIVGSQKPGTKNTKLEYAEPFQKIGNPQPCVSFVKDAHGKKFVVKNHLDPEQAIREVLGSKIGENIININEVQIIPHHSSLQDKDYKVSTLHTFIPGKHNKKHLIFHAITRNKHLKNIAQKDKSLAQIAAFNMYTNNWDCHSNNLLENKKTNQFHLIDMDAAFNNKPWSLMSASHDYLTSLRRDDLFRDEVNALKVVDETLGKLMTYNPPTQTYLRWEALCNEVNYNPDISAIVSLHSILHHNYNEAMHVRSQLKCLTIEENVFSMKQIAKDIAKPSKSAEQNFWQTINS